MQSKERFAIVPFIFLSTVSSFWFYQVCATVPEPYLDEVFHVRQAEAYWANKWRVWDPKITTPPGLYVLSYAWLSILRLCRIPVGPTTFTQHLRSLNLLGLAGIYAISRRLLLVEARRGKVLNRGNGHRLPLQTTWSIEHTALNICLFPPLFFFCALYYTDVVSVLLVLLSFDSFHRRNSMALVASSALSLTLRQTNIFWTAVYLAGLEILRHVKEGGENEDFQAQLSLSKMMELSWKRGCFYDPLIQDAWFEDYFKTVVSLGTAVSSQLLSLVLPLAPYVLLLTMFATFIILNGGVVLGDKENHIASLHIPQLLYIWPYITFFSFPILIMFLIPTLFDILPSSVLNALPTVIRPNHAHRVSASRRPRKLLLLAILIPTLDAVHFNTLVHPFTLADNRHYTFYVFRLLLRHSATRYLVTPLYLLLSWVSIQSLTSSPHTQASALSTSSSATPLKAATGPVDSTPSQSSSDSSQFIGSDDRNRGQRISFLLLWLLTSSLGLITAPLVEPRYFILPWLTWRLRIPLPTSQATSLQTTPVPSEPSNPETFPPSSSWNLWQTILHPNNTLWFETAWLLALNVGTGYIFLKWGFEWKEEPGRVQRFMW